MPVGDRGSGRARAPIGRGPAGDERAAAPVGGVRGRRRLRGERAVPAQRLDGRAADRAAHRGSGAPLSRRRITAEKAAIAAVMAGCTPGCMPVVAALVRAVCEPEYGLHGCTASTGGSAPFVVVNGPIRREIGMNATH